MVETLGHIDPSEAEALHKIEQLVIEIGQICHRRHSHTGFPLKSIAEALTDLESIRDKLKNSYELTTPAPQVIA